MNGFYWLASYPKSGNTWLRLALQSLQHQGSPVNLSDADAWFPIASAREPMDSVLDIESSDLTADELEDLRPCLYRTLAQMAEQPMIRKVHDAWTLTSSGEPTFPAAVTLGVVYIVRDPRDIAVSYAHHANCSIDASIDTMGDSQACLSGSGSSLRPQMKQRLLRWSEHVLSWLDAPDTPLLPLRYEAMIADPCGSLMSAAVFLGWQPGPDAVFRATEATRFDVLKAGEEQYGFREKPATMKRFFRSGRAGSWTEVLTPAQAGRIEREHGAVMARLGYL